MLHLAPQATSVAARVLAVALCLVGCDGAPVAPANAGASSAPASAARSAVTPPTGRLQGVAAATTAPGAPRRAAQPPAKPAAGSADPAALTAQEDYPRVRAARREKAPAIRQLFAEAGLRYPAHQLLIRIFKAEDQVELWVQPAAERPFEQLKTYPICARSGTLGPKRVAGDRQVPEGFYRIDRFNPASRFHLSLGLDYPNASDKVLSDPDRPGGDIFIHGRCVTIGCVPLTDPLIKELYIIALDAHEAGRPVAVHVFPGRMAGASWDELAETARANPGLLSFWQNLREGYGYFETHKRLPTISVDSRGRYSFQ